MTSQTLSLLQSFSKAITGGGEVRNTKIEYPKNEKNFLVDEVKMHFS